MPDDRNAADPEDRFHGMTLADEASGRYPRRMSRWATIRGHLHGRVVELDEPVDAVEDGNVEVQIRSVKSATPRPPDRLEVIATLPQGHRTKADIDQQLASDRSDWTGRS
jgi:hypothetical protein